MNEKVKLPREVAEAIGHSGMTHREIFNHIATYKPGNITTAKLETIHSYYRLYPYSIAKALIIGYEVEEEDITVTITPEQQGELRRYCENLRTYRKNAKTSAEAVELLAELDGALNALSYLKIKIRGVNDQ